MVASAVRGRDAFGAEQHVHRLADGSLRPDLENGAAAFQPKGRSDHQAEQERIAYLEKKIQRKDEVLAELMGEHIALKKELGEL